MSETYWFWQISGDLWVPAIRREARPYGKTPVTWAYLHPVLGVEIPFTHGDRRTNIRQMSDREILATEATQVEPTYAWIGRYPVVHQPPSRYVISVVGELVLMEQPLHHTHREMNRVDRDKYAVSCRVHALQRLIDFGKGTIAMPTDSMTNRRSDPERITKHIIKAHIEPSAAVPTVRVVKTIEVIFGRAAVEAALIEYTQRFAAAADDPDARFKVELPDLPTDFEAKVIVTAVENG